MPLPTVWTSTFQATTLDILSAIGGYHLSDWVWVNIDLDIDEQVESKSSSFYPKTLPRLVFCLLCVNPLRYWWHMWLERVLPTRPRAALSAAQGPSHQSAENDVVEEKIIAEWIAQGKIRRSSVSWFNIVAKWIIDLIFGNLWRVIMLELLERIVKFGPLSELFEEFAFAVAVAYVPYFFSLSPLVSLMGFIVIPAYKRMVFEDGVNLLWTIFIHAFLGAMIPWLMTFEAVQEGFNRTKEAMKNASMNAHANDSLSEL